MDLWSDCLGFLRAAKFGDLGAGSEDPVATADNQRSRRIVSQFLCCCTDLGNERTGERVDLAVGEGEDGNAVVESFESEEFVGHERQPRRSRDLSEHRDRPDDVTRC